MAKIKYTTMKATYAVNASGPITLVVQYGYAQIGGSAALIDEKPVPPKPQSNDETFLLGDAKDLLGRNLLVKSVVSDENDTTNKMSVIYRFEGGVSPQTYVSESVVDENGDVMAFYGEFTFNK